MTEAGRIAADGDFINEGGAHMRVYAVREGGAVRLGVVSPTAETELALTCLEARELHRVLGTVLLMP